MGVTSIPVLAPDRLHTNQIRGWWKTHNPFIEVSAPNLRKLKAIRGEFTKLLEGNVCGGVGYEYFEVIVKRKKTSCVGVILFPISFCVKYIILLAC